jgi:2-iminobutanoate/2-iminopropanoate deaminase
MTRRAALLIVVVGIVLACRPSAPAGSPHGPEYLASPQTLSLGLPLSDAVRAGDFLFVSGQLGTVDGTDALAPGGIGPEAAQALDNVKAILERHGSSMDAVVKCTVFLADIREWAAFNAVYREHFRAHFPARSALGSSGLSLGARVELECTAYAPAARLAPSAFTQPIHDAIRPQPGPSSEAHWSPVTRNSCERSRRKLYA